jgi:hypothetical protein
MAPITLKNQTATGEPLEATFLPDKGMNLISYKKGAIELIDPSTQSLFEERYAGLGALIGPHFHHRHAPTIPSVPDESLFPHIARVKAKGIQEPFSHGIARYAPWQAQATATKVQAKLTGKDLWNGVPLSALEGQSFTYSFEAELQPDGLHLALSITSETDSLVGTHYYYHLPKGRGLVTSQIQREFIEKNERKPLSPHFNVDAQQVLRFDLKEEADYTFFPFPDPCAGKITLDAELYTLTISYSCVSQENCWQLYHPAGASFVCIEPMSAKDPRHPILTASQIHIHLQV